MGILYWLNVLRLMLCLFFLSLASLHDIKSREVPDRVWIIFAPSGSALTLLSLILSGWNLQNLLAFISSIVLTACIALIFFYLGMFGGADAKALICIAVATPTYPEDDFRLSTKPILPMFPVSILNNAVLLSSSLVLVMIAKNLFDVIVRKEKIFEGLETENPITKIFALITGFRVDAEKLHGWRHHFIVMEEIYWKENGVIMRRLKLLKPLSLKEESVKVPEEFDGKVWVTVSLPFLVFITLGFLTTVFVGDVIFWLATQLIKHFS